ncbi:MAG: hypothetical protein ACNS60_06835 [Candidatus Cyclobacteriaceae bacterium M2_1C_046]
MRVSIILYFILIPTFGRTQNLFNSKSDTLQHFQTIYVSTIEKDGEVKMPMAEGFYALIFDIKVDQSQLDLQINSNIYPPVLYEKHNGYITFNNRQQGTYYLKINYSGTAKPDNIYGRLYRPAPLIIGTPMPAFEFKDINNKIYTDAGLKGMPTIFLKSANDEYLDLIKELVQELNDPVNTVVFSRKAIPDLRSLAKKYAEPFIFTASPISLLGDWVETISMHNILITDREGNLKYKNRITRSDKYFKDQLKKELLALFSRE